MNYLTKVYYHIFWHNLKAYNEICINPRKSWDQAILYHWGICGFKVESEKENDQNMCQNAFEQIGLISFGLLFRREISYVFYVARHHAIEATTIKAYYHNNPL